MQLLDDLFFLYRIVEFPDNDECFELLFQFFLDDIHFCWEQSN